MTTGERQHLLISKALSLLPALAVVLVIASSWFAAAPDIVGARIYGGPPAPDRTLAWRVVALLRDRGFYEPLEHTPVSLRLHTDPPIDLHGMTDDEGAWEARIQLPPSYPDEVNASVTLPQTNDLLMSRPVSIQPVTWKSAFRRAPPRIDGRQHGDLAVELSLRRAIIASSFPEKAVVVVTRDGLPVESAALSLSGDGVSFEPKQGLTTDHAGRAWVTILPTFPAPQIRVRATDKSGAEGTLDGVLPVKTGAMWLDPDKIQTRTISVISPVRHRYAYLTLFTHRARLWGTRLSLSPDDVGGANGATPLPPIPDEPVWLMVSPDPQGTGDEKDLYGWPLIQSSQEPMNAAHATTVLLADGMPRAVDAAQQRKHAGRLRAMLILAVAALLESLLLLLRASQAKRELDEAFATQADLDETVRRALLGGSRFWLKMMIAAFLVAIGFGSLAFVTWMGAI